MNFALQKLMTIFATQKFLIIIMNSPVLHFRSEYIVPACRVRETFPEKNFLASGTGEDMDPIPGLWDDENA